MWAAPDGIAHACNPRNTDFGSPLGRTARPANDTLLGPQAQHRRGRDEQGAGAPSMVLKLLIERTIHPNPSVRSTIALLLRRTQRLHRATTRTTSPGLHVSPVGGRTDAERAAAAMPLARRAVGGRPGPLGPIAQGQRGPVIGRSNCASTSASGVVSLELRLSNRTGVDRVATTTRATIGVISHGDGVRGRGGLAPMRPPRPIAPSPRTPMSASCVGERARRAKRPLAHTPRSRRNSRWTSTSCLRGQRMSARVV